MRDLIRNLIGVALATIASWAIVLLFISMTPSMCEPGEMSRLRYATGGGVACWLLEPIEE